MKNNNKAIEDWGKIGKSAAVEIKISPKRLKYIEARGFLCHELLYLLNGRIEFVETPWKQYLLKILEYLFPISPICRWYPLRNSMLEWVGHDMRNETKVYRLTLRESQIVFFVEYKPEPPAAGWFMRPFFNVPQLDIGKFLRPPFKGDNDNTKIEPLLRKGLVETFKPPLMTMKARKRVGEIHMATCRGLWEEFCK